MTEPNNTPGEQTVSSPDDLLGPAAAPDAAQQRRRRLVRGGLALLLLVLVGYGIWQWVSGLNSVQRKAPDVATIIPLPPPPPPPPEPEPPPPEPEEKPPEELVEPEPTPEPEPVPAEVPQPDEAPRPADDLSQAMEMNADAQAGGDAFNIAAGSGRGMGGSGGGRVGNATYGQYMSYALQKILREDERTRTLAYRVQVNIWLTESGQVARVELVRSSGDAQTDDKVIAALRAVPALAERPPASLAMPVRAVLNSRRPS